MSGRLVNARWKNKDYQYPLVEVLWDDATSVSGEEWADISEAIKCKPAKTVSVGYMVADKDSHVTLVATVNSHHIGHGILIPRGMIKEIRFLQSVT